MTTMTKVSDILKTVRDSVDFGCVDCYPGESEDAARTAFWQEVLHVKANDTGFGALVLAILANVFDPESPIGWDDEEKCITEGHHRLVAAILLGLDEVPTSRWGGGTGAICAHDCACNGEDWEDGGFFGKLDLWGR